MNATRRLMLWVKFNMQPSLCTSRELPTLFTRGLVLFLSSSVWWWTPCLREKPSSLYIWRLLFHTEERVTVQTCKIWSQLYEWKLHAVLPSLLLLSDEGVRSWLVPQLKFLCGRMPPEGAEETRLVQQKVMSSKDTFLITHNFYIVFLSANEPIKIIKVAFLCLWLVKILKQADI